MPELAPKLAAVAEVQGPRTWKRGLLCRIHMLGTKRAKGTPLKKGPWLLVHGPKVLAEQIHLGVISFGFLPLCNTAVRPSRLSTQ